MLDEDKPDGVEISQDKTGVYVAFCTKCGRVIGVKHTSEELQRARAEHVCADKKLSIR